MTRHGCALDDITLRYTTDDDGVLLFCRRCCQSGCLGFDATSADVVEWSEAHMAGLHSQNLQNRQSP